MTPREDPFIEDRLTTVHRSRSGKNPYLAAIPPVLILAAVVLVGALGPRPHSTDAQPAAANGTADRDTPAAIGGPTASPLPRSDIAAELGLVPVTVDAGSLEKTVIPGTSDKGDSIAIAGQRVFVARGSAVLEYDLGSGDYQKIQEFDTGSVAALAARGDRLAILEYEASPLTPGATGEPEVPGAAICEAAPCVLDYHVWLSPGNGPSQEVGEFSVSGAATPGSGFPGSEVKLALGSDTWAISRPVPREGLRMATTIDVHADSGELLWSTSTDGGVLDLELGGTSLMAVVFDAASIANLGVSTTAQALAHASEESSVEVASAKYPDLVPLGSGAISASMSSDGRGVAWDDGACLELQRFQDGAPEVEVVPATCPRQPGVIYRRPSVDTGSDGFLGMVWLAGGVDGNRLVVRSPRLTGEVVVVNADNPDWAILQGDFVCWGKSTAAGLEIDELDLAAGIPGNR